MIAVEIFYLNVFCVSYPKGIGRQIPKSPALGINICILGNKKTFINSFGNIGIINIDIFKSNIFNPFYPTSLLKACNYNGKLNSC